MKFNAKIMITIISYIIACSLALKSSRNKKHDYVEKCKSKCGITEKHHLYYGIIDGTKTKILCQCKGIVFDNWFSMRTSDDNPEFNKVDHNSRKDFDQIIKTMYKEYSSKRRY